MPPASPARANGIRARNATVTVAAVGSTTTAGRPKLFAARSTQ
jgi:hypothetical protein